VSIYASLLAAFIISLSSTATIVKVLEYIGELRTDVGHISIGVLIAQDIAVVPMMLVIKQCDGGVFNVSMLLDLAMAVLLVFVLIRYIGRSERIKLPLMNLISTPDLTPVVTLGLCFTSASLVVFLGLSEAYGAFLAGLFIGNTGERQHIMASIKPIQDVLLMVFFLSVGLMFDLNFLTKNWILVIVTLLFVTIWKVISNTVILRRFSIELAKATSIGIILAQLGEFSLILSNVAISSNIIDIHGQKLIVCVTALSLSISPFFIALSTRTKNLSFVGDNSLSSVMKIIFSGKFAKEVRNLVTKSPQSKN
jgi:CPA2 family monovalent cation:H+ antiporter-2